MGRGRTLSAPDQVPDAFGATAVLGTTDNNALDLRVNGARAMRLQPTGGSPNVIGGHANNAAVPSYEGQTIAGGGTAGANCFDPPTGTTTRSCANLTNSLYATVSGGYANQANSFWSAGAVKCSNGLLAASAITRAAISCWSRGSSLSQGT